MGKVCTDLVQSKKLVELGLDANTADMWYQYIGISIKDGSEKPIYFPMVIRDDESDEDIPAWSLSALYDIFPNNDRYSSNLYKTQKGWCSDIREEQSTEFTHTEYPTELKSFYCSNSVDAAFEMVCWLLENKII